MSKEKAGWNARPNSEDFGGRTEILNHKKAASFEAA
jgi:hypothetical protein